MNPKSPLRKIDYNGRSYEFTNEVFFKQVDMNLLLELSCDIKKMFQNIVESLFMKSIVKIEPILVALKNSATER